VLVVLLLIGGGIVTWLALRPSDDNPNLTDPNPVGVVWWRPITNNTLSGDLPAGQPCDITLLNFAYQNSVNEIYLNQHVLRDVNPPNADNPLGFFGPNGLNYLVAPTRAFIALASERNISVFMTIGDDGGWLVNRTQFDNIMRGLRVYQSIVEDNEKFAGVQFNIEPHQQTDWNENRTIWLQRKIDFVEHVTDTYGDEFTLDWIIPFWWRESSTDRITHRNEENVLAYRAIIREADRVSVMAFRNTAETMIHVSTDILNYANQLEKEVILMGTIIYTGGEQSPHAQFLESGNDVMLYQLGRLPNLVAQEFQNVKISTAIHHIITWYNMVNA